MTSLMPSLPALGLDDEGRELQGVVFTTLSEEQRAKGYPEGEDLAESERIGMVIVSQECEWRVPLSLSSIYSRAGLIASNRERCTSKVGSDRV
jgi:hypothetical protein